MQLAGTNGADEKESEETKSERNCRDNMPSTVRQVLSAGISARRATSCCCFFPFSQDWPRHALRGKLPKCKRFAGDALCPQSRTLVLPLSTCRGNRSLSPQCTNRKSRQCSFFFLRTEAHICPARAHVEALVCAEDLLFSSFSCCGCFSHDIRLLSERCTWTETSIHLRWRGYVNSVGKGRKTTFSPSIGPPPYKRG